MKPQFVPKSAKPCPFCGNLPWAEKWHGGGPNKHIVGCDNDDCQVAPSVTGESLSAAVRIWNRRIPK